MEIAQDNETIETKIEDLVIKKSLSRTAKDAILDDFFPLYRTVQKKKKQDEKRAFEEIKKQDEENL